MARPLPAAKVLDFQMAYPGGVGLHFRKNGIDLPNVGFFVELQKMAKGGGCSLRLPMKQKPHPPEGPRAPAHLRPAKAPGATGDGGPGNKDSFLRSRILFIPRAKPLDRHVHGKSLQLNPRRSSRLGHPCAQACLNHSSQTLLGASNGRPRPSIGHPKGVLGSQDLAVGPKINRIGASGLLNNLFDFFLFF